MCGQKSSFNIWAKPKINYVVKGFISKDVRLSLQESQMLSIDCRPLMILLRIADPLDCLLGSRFV